MRVPVRARRCNLNWPASTVGKKSLPQPGNQEHQRNHGSREKASKEQAPVVQADVQPAAVALTESFETPLQSGSASGPGDCGFDTAGVGFVPRSRYLAMVGTSVRESR